MEGAQTLGALLEEEPDGAGGDPAEYDPELAAELRQEEGLLIFMHTFSYGNLLYPITHNQPVLLLPSSVGSQSHQTRPVLDGHANLLLLIDLVLLGRGLPRVVGQRPALIEVIDFLQHQLQVFEVLVEEHDQQDHQDEQDEDGGGQDHVLAGFIGDVQW